MRAWRTAPARLPPPPCTTTIAAPVRDGTYQPARRKPSELRNQTLSWGMASAAAGTALRGFPLTNSAVATGITTHSSASAVTTTPTARRPQRAGRRRAGACASVTTAQPSIATPAGTSSSPVHAPPSAEPTLTCQTARPPATAAMSPATNAPSARGPRGSRGQTPTAPAANSTATIAAGAPVDALSPRHDDRKAASSQCSAHRPAAAAKTDVAFGARPTPTRAGRIRTAATDMARDLFDRDGAEPAATRADGAAAVERVAGPDDISALLRCCRSMRANVPRHDLAANAGCPPPDGGRPTAARAVCRSRRSHAPNRGPTLLSAGSPVGVSAPRTACEPEAWCRRPADC